jgi:hypothetical protein
MPSAAMTMAATQASKKAFIVFHPAGLAERKSIQSPDTSDNSLARRYASVEKACWRLAARYGSASSQAELARQRLAGQGNKQYCADLAAHISWHVTDVSGAPTDVRSSGNERTSDLMPRVKQVTFIVSHWV